MKRSIQALFFGVLLLLAVGCTTVTRQSSAEDVANPPSVSSASDTKNASTDKTGSSQPSWFGQIFVMFWAALAGGQGSSQ